MEERPQRFCDVCKQVDDHPRHVQPLKPPAPQIIRHFDCCAAQGCEVCIETEQQTGGLRGQALIDHLTEVRAAAKAATEGEG